MSVANAGQSEVTDLRVLRGMRNRAAVVDALIELIDEGELTPTAALIAERAGVSLRSIHNLFEDLDDVSRSVADKTFAAVAELWRPNPTEGPLELRVRAFVPQRAALVERSLNVYRASLLSAHASEPVAERIAFVSEFFRGVVQNTFAIELRRAPPWKLEALDSITSIDGWVRLRIHQGLTVAQAKRVLARTVPAILTAD